MKLTLILAFVSLISFRPANCVVVNELMVNPATHGEWIELYNPDVIEIDLYGWSLTDEAGHKSVVSHGVISGNGYIVIAEDAETLDLLNIPADKRGTTEGQWCSLNNSGDRIQLVNGAGDLIDVIEYEGKAGQARGYSWERINSDVVGNYDSNWSRSVATEGHTAGYANSLKYTGDQLTLSLWAEPNPFDPSIGEKVTIHFDATSPEARISVSIYDLRGRSVLSLANNLLIGTNSHPLLWDGRDDRGETLPIGRYIVYAKVIDNRSGVTVEKKSVVVVAGSLR